MPKQKPSQPQADVHAKDERCKNHGKRNKDRASRDAPETLNRVPVEQAEGTNVSNTLCIETVGVTPH